jgi:uncharacterized protein
VTFRIPSGVLAQHVIALGKTRSGKSTAVRVLVEGLLDADKPVCIVDPKGDWWGIKSSADGKKAGYPLVIFGGEHADVPINEHSGAAVAELIATGNRSCLIDLGGWMVGERTRFFVAFASALFKLSRGARHLVIDEVHNFAPQGKILDPDAGKMLHWANRLASEGLGKGIVILAASQRPQKVHKDFLTSCETLIAKQVIHKLDRDAIKDWIDGCADPLKGKEVIASLAQLKKPQAWIWSPEIEYGPMLIEFPLFNTFDSFKPQPENAAALTGWASVDLEQVKTKLAKVVEETKANDPRELKKRIAELERQAKQQQPAPAAINPAAAERAYKEGFAKGQQRIVDQLEVYYGSLEYWAKDMPRPPVFKAEVWSTPMRPAHQAPAPRAPVPRPQVKPYPDGEKTLTGAAMKILAVLSQFPEGCLAGKLTLLSGYRYTGTFRNALSELRTNGCIQGDNGAVMKITPEGLRYGPFPELPQGQALIDYWINNPMFSGAARKILGVLVDGEERTAGELTAATGYEYTGTFRNALSELRTAGVIEGANTGYMRISPEIVP